MNELYWQVCSKEEQDILNRGSKKSDRLRQSLLQRGGGGSMAEGGDGERMSHALSVSAKLEQGLQQAVAHRDKLLQFDKTR